MRMNTSSRRSSSFRIPAYGQNAVLQLIVASGLGYIIFTAIYVTMEVFGVKGGVAYNSVGPWVGLPPVREFTHHWWTIFTYGWVHYRFFEWLSNMVWLYTFGSVVQTLVGHRQVVPTYIYGLLAGGLFYLAMQLIPGLPPAPTFLMTGGAGVMALAAATVTLAPKYRFYIGENFNIPLLVVVGIYLALNLLAFATYLPMLMLAAGGLLAGYVTMTMLNRGYRPGAWMYSIVNAIGNSMTPDENKFNKSGSRRQQTVTLTRRPTARDISQTRVDEILEKIHQRGYASLTPEEREILMQAAKETQD
jgi:membrane associated rhomboid family serine protease